ncbi:MAG: DUF6249 domain-containing protein [Acetobacteraceae bacterium]|nr:DUF6249 domain-containing protein [Acetobacteraceae bacterium]
MSLVSAVGVLFPVLVLALVLGFVFLMRYLKHREHMAMIQRGIAPHQAAEATAPELRDRRSRLHGGLITTAVGLALTLGLLTLGFGPWLLGGLIPMFVGLATLLGYFLTDCRPKGADGSPNRQKGGGGAEGTGGCGP